MIKPNFFIVGAPKCGTTAMNDYLNQHPDIFMAKKELHYFGSDLKGKEKISNGEYLRHFENAGNKKIIGEASVWYLFSKTAATEIKHFCPEAKILIMLRNPADVIYSLHSQHLFDGNEDIQDFREAVGLDEDRKKAERLPKSVDFTALPPYLDTVMFFDQVKRYFDVFGAEKVFIILYEDLVADTRREVLNTFQFLGLKSDMLLEYAVINSNKKIKSFYLHRLLKYPPTGLKKIIRIVMPFKRIRHSFMASLSKHNIKSEKREDLPQDIRDSLNQKLAGDVDKLRKLINKDLSRWLQ
jgi:hypothetical protein